MKINVELDEKEYNGKAKYAKFLKMAFRNARSSLLLSGEKDLDLSVSSMGKTLLHLTVDRDMSEDFFELTTVVSAANENGILALPVQDNFGDIIKLETYESLGYAEKTKIIVSHYGNIKQSELSVMLGLDKSTVSIIIKGLRGAGLVKAISKGKFHIIRAEEKLINEVKSDEKLREILNELASINKNECQIVTKEDKEMPAQSSNALLQIKKRFATYRPAIFEKIWKKISQKFVMREKKGQPIDSDSLHDTKQKNPSEIAAKIIDILRKNGKRMPQKIIADTLKTTDAEIDSAIKVINNNGGLKITKEILHQKSPEIKEVCMITLLG